MRVFLRSSWNVVWTMLCSIAVIYGFMLIVIAAFFMVAYTVKYAPTLISLLSS